MPTTRDQGQVTSKMIYLHITKPHSLTQTAICSKKKINAKARAKGCHSPLLLGPRTWCRAGKDTWANPKGAARPKLKHPGSAVITSGWQEGEFSWGLERPTCVKSCRPAVALMQYCQACTCTTPTPQSCKIQLQQTLACRHLTCCNTMSQDPNAIQLKKKLVLQFSCTRCVISNTFDNLQRAISGYVTGLTCNHRFGFKVLNRIPSYLSLNFSREPEKYYFHKSYYAHNALEGKHRHCPCPKSIKHGYYRPKESSRLAPVKKNHCYSTNCKTT